LYTNKIAYRYFEENVIMKTVADLEMVGNLSCYLANPRGEGLGLGLLHLSEMFAIRVKIMHLKGKLPNENQN
jgi:hypothetical protein